MVFVNCTADGVERLVDNHLAVDTAPRVSDNIV
jgi:hypothetical protein